MTFDGGQVISDARLLPIRGLDLKLGILSEAARRMPDPRSEKALTHSAEDILTQQVYQFQALRLAPGRSSTVEDLQFRVVSGHQSDGLSAAGQLA